MTELLVLPLSSLVWFAGATPDSCPHFRIFAPSNLLRPFFSGASFFGIEMSFLWYRGGRSLLFGIEISFFGIEILYSVVQHLYRPLLGINLCVLLWASTSCKVEVNEDLDAEKKIEKSRYLKKDISIPTNLVKESPLLFWAERALSHFPRSTLATPPAPQHPSQPLSGFPRFSLDRANGRGGLGSQTAAAPPRRPSENPEKQTVCTVTASHKILSLQALLSSLSAGTAKRGCLSRGKAFGSPPAVLSPRTAASIYTF